MNYITIIFIAIIGIILGYSLAKRNNTPISEQSKKKQENKDKVFAFVQKNREIKNSDVERLLGVSDATAERYLNELEKEGKITQHGKIGQNVFYTLK
ncbi:MAG: DUF977 family protein [Candidatus Pacebacteria bacterium]|jgi:predicted HTH transcriptional regulator|nr:DUF977 family protein [Candidatus Paceibacterota bacterium]MDP7466071.1 DUF977 family protein [Candidatus Paceibacterota bacterium]MDP7648232.1 DUF977 family protein [Candidatus Paceibacterota bacterium]HJN62906.1 DUF977 family protein [Candidatus Paceibacterota bacterium]|tara:strand:+ start:64 stop:354 length:291 start_codon:yes stop_codon:yes gene_type:complete